jgi:hypothetical protein
MNQISGMKGLGVIRFITRLIRGQGVVLGSYWEEADDGIASPIVYAEFKSSSHPDL